MFFFFFFFNDPATTEIYTLSLHDALPIFFARCLRPVPSRHGERWSNLDHRNTRERSLERVWPTPAQNLGRAAPPARKSPPPSLNRLERLSCALQEPSPGGTRRKPLNCLSA